MVDFENDINNCIVALSKGRTILYPTDTVWGLGCDATDEDAVEKIFRIKHRPKEKSFIVLLADVDDILKYVAYPPANIIAIIKSFDRPTTVIYTSPVGFPANVINSDGSLAIRITTDPFCKSLIKRFKKPIVSTSANLSGHPSAPIYSMIDKAVSDNVDYVVSYRQDDNIIAQPSRLVRVKETGEMEILRA